MVTLVKVYQLKKGLPFSPTDDFVSVRIGNRFPTPTEMLDLYEIVYKDTLDFKHGVRLDQKLESLFKRFNLESQDTYTRNYSMSVGDLVSIDDKLYMCFGIGFLEMVFERLI